MTKTGEESDKVVRDRLTVLVLFFFTRTKKIKTFVFVLCEKKGVLSIHETSPTCFELYLNIKRQIQI